MMLTIAIIAAAAILIAVAFFGWYRPWQLSWGATPEDLARSMPGDEIVRRPIFNATRGVTVNAPPEEIWPWIVQIGFWRAGWYTYDLLDNAGRRSAERIVPELQHMEVGDLVPLGPGKDSGLRVKEFVPNRSMVWWSKKDHRTTWVWSLDPMPDGKTRLLTRVRAPISWGRASNDPVARDVRARRLSHDAKVPARHKAPGRDACWRQWSHLTGGPQRVEQRPKHVHPN